MAMATTMDQREQRPEPQDDTRDLIYADEICADACWWAFTREEREQLLICDDLSWRRALGVP